MDIPDGGPSEHVGVEEAEGRCEGLGAGEGMTQQLLCHAEEQGVGVAVVAWAWRGGGGGTDQLEL